MILYCVSIVDFGLWLVVMFTLFVLWKWVAVRGLLSDRRRLEGYLPNLPSPGILPQSCQTRHL